MAELRIHTVVIKKTAPGAKMELRKCPKQPWKLAETDMEKAETATDRESKTDMEQSQNGGQAGSRFRSPLIAYRCSECPLLQPANSQQSAELIGLAWPNWNFTSLLPYQLQFNPMQNSNFREVQFE